MSVQKGETLTVDSFVPFLILQEQQKYAQLQEIIKKLDEEKKRGDSLLYAMIPKAVADRLRKGITALETCQVQDSAVNTGSSPEKPQNIRASASEKNLLFLPYFY